MIPHYCILLKELTYYHSSFTLIDLYATFLQRVDDESLVILQIDLSIIIKVSHLHPALYVLLGGVIVHSQHVIGFLDQIWDFVLTQETAFVFVELLE